MFTLENLSNMKKDNISEDFQDIFLGKDFPKKDKITSLSKANDTYNKLLNKGTIKKRGYTLRGIEDSHLLRFSFNKP